MNELMDSKTFISGQEPHRTLDDSNAKPDGQKEWWLWPMDSSPLCIDHMEDEEPPPERVNPSEVLTKLRSFCRKFFKTKIDDSKKIELARDLNKYLSTICRRICDRLNTEMLDNEPNVVEVGSPSLVFGDIHGNLEDLYDYEEKYWSKESDQFKNYLFLGDFVDRGGFSFEVSLYLFCLKLTDQNKFILVRGNHEVRLVNKGYTFHSECVRKFGDTLGQSMWDSVNTCFERLPLVAVVDMSVFCCHGGVPKSLTTLAELKAVPKPLVDPAAESPGAHEILWSDPIESIKDYNKEMEKSLRKKKTDFIENKKRSTAFYYTALAVKNFLDSNGLTFMIRAHENVDQGFKYTSDKKCLTVFSSSNYCGKNNSTACATIKDKKVEHIILKKGTE